MKYLRSVIKTTMTATSIGRNKGSFHIGVFPSKGTLETSGGDEALGTDADGLFDLLIVPL